MADKLIIVESPAKATTIKKFLGGNVKVLASMGHIRDLPKSKLAIDIENDFTPEYINIRGKGALIKTLKKEAKNAKYVYLATDPDREGEAIAWHLAYILEIPEDEVCRVTFNEITKEAIQKSIKSPRKIDKDLTDAQQARRVLDRIVGYKISPILWKKVKRGLSAGRVQSVAVKLIVDREEEIEKFIPEEYWNITAQLLEPKTEKTFEANFYGKEGKKLELHSKEDVDNIIKQIEKGQYIVTDVKKGEKKRTPAPPFTTSTMQQEASRKLGFTLKRTMSIAQGLYEGVNVGAKGTVGLITYMRTDSTRISEEARAYAKEHIVKTYGENYYENRYYKTKQNSQDAHEAIRPTYIDLEPETIKQYLTPEQYKLYKLIYNRFIASQMSAAIYNTVSANIDVNTYNFRASGQNLKFKGFMTLYVEVLENEKEEVELSLPELEIGATVIKQKLNSKQSFTAPPPRYTEASLVKALEEKGIGRPSTYSPTITTILERRYIEKEQKQLMPTELGKVVNKLLVENFPNIIDVEFTAKIEEEFDAVAEGKENWKQILREFYPPFKEQLDKAEKELEHVTIADEVTDIPCEKCGRMMVIKYGRYGKFLACPGYPECKNAKPIVENIDVPCPVCGAKVQVRKTKRKKKYYICEHNPETCNYISWNKPKIGEKWEPEKEKEVTKPKRKTRKKK
ncbi:MAG: type I DNA topoisomerase [Clostridia bacterium]|jgi:DNA topoisomerase-1|nr:type I DNA topoisomerase [Clostridia bacterium]MEE0790223.1 type I DNA topoisomerase [Clostridia bacterium]HJJ10129.1 type I DNA topoisomerase [Clostridiaceae bacterium]